MTPAERAAILAYYDTHAPEGYRRLTFMMLDADIVAVSPATVYRVLKQAGVLDRWNHSASKKGTGFVQPLRPHEHWHIDISYVNIAGTFYYLCSILDGATRFLVHWELRERMTTADVATVLQRARERFPGAHPRIISDNGPQFIARDFKEFIRVAGMTHVRTSPYYPQSNGKLERYQQTLKVTTIRPKAPASLDEARRLVTTFVDYYNHQRLHSAIGFIAPADMLAGRAEDIWTARDQKLEAARARRRMRWKEQPEKTASQNRVGATITTRSIPNPLPESPAPKVVAASLEMAWGTAIRFEGLEYDRLWVDTERNVQARLRYIAAPEPAQLVITVSHYRASSH